MSDGSAGLDQYAGPQYRRLLAAARKSMERTGGDLSGRVSVANPDDAERKAIIGVTGVYVPGTTARLTVPLAELDAAVRGGTGLGLADLLATLGGPLRDRPAEVASLAGARASLIATAQASPLHERCPWYQAWLADLRRDGTLTRLASQSEGTALGQAIRALEYVAGPMGAGQLAAGTPAAGQAVGALVALPELAARITGDTKSLNHGTTLATLILRALALRAGVTRPASAAARRELWELSGVIVDDLSSRVLVLNLPAQGDGLAHWLTDAARYATPFQVTLHQLGQHPILVSQQRIFVCENPAVLRRACAELGARCPPFLCTEGRPSVAFHRLAQLAVSGGAQLWYHGDFDWPGMAIAADVIARYGALAWLMSAGDYQLGAGANDSYLALDGDPVPTPWDPELGALMRATGRAVYEETVADHLLADLARHAIES